MLNCFRKNEQPIILALKYLGNLRNQYTVFGEFVNHENPFECNKVI